MRDTGARRRSGRTGAVLRGESVPSRVRVIPRSVIQCPDCGAGVGEGCTSSTGNPTRYHVSRLRLTTQLYNEQHKKAPSRKALTLLGRASHALAPEIEPGEVSTLCGIKVRYIQAVAQNKLRSGTAADVRCAECRKELEG